MQADVVICGGGIAGVAAAYHLTVRQGMKDVVVVDERPLLTLTSDKSTEAYRNWWPGPGDAMIGLMNRSIDLLEELAGASDNFFHLNRRGYVYLTAVPETAQQMAHSAQQIAAMGAGELRSHHAGNVAYQPAHPHDYRNQPTGADLLWGSDLIRQHFPFVADDVVAALHVRRAGWLSAQQLGMYLWQEAKAHGARLVNGRLTHVHLTGGRVGGVQVESQGQTVHLSTRHFVNAAGPYVTAVSRMMGVQLPIHLQVHAKIALEDPLGVIPRTAPLMIWHDAVRLPWAEEEAADLAESDETRWLLNEFPPGAHFRPEGGRGSETLLLLWPYHVAEHNQPRWPLTFDPDYPEVALRGLARLAPGLARYFERRGKPIVDGGYYTRTPENRPLIGPLPVSGAYVLGALSGYGVMAALAAGELLAAHVCGGSLPPYAPAFSLSRYDDPIYQALLADWAEDGQL
jgi:sarcosine oxidase, subunit beta